MKLHAKPFLSSLLLSCLLLFSFPVLCQPKMKTAKDSINFYKNLNANILLQYDTINSLLRQVKQELEWKTRYESMLKAKNEELKTQKEELDGLNLKISQHQDSLNRRQARVEKFAALLATCKEERDLQKQKTEQLNSALAQLNKAAAKWSPDSLNRLLNLQISMAEQTAPEAGIGSLRQFSDLYAFWQKGQQLLTLGFKNAAEITSHQQQIADQKKKAAAFPGMQDELRRQEVLFSEYPVKTEQMHALFEGINKDRIKTFESKQMILDKVMWEFLDYPFLLALARNYEKKQGYGGKNPLDGKVNAK
jgi:hypothetical protein